MSPNAIGKTKMTNLNNLLKGISPKTKRVSTNMPLNQWIDEFNTNGIVIIDAYVSNKKKENLNGHQTSKLRKLFVSGDSNLEPEINEALETQFATAYYAVGVNAKKQTVFIVVAPTNVQAMENAGYSLKIMTEAQRDRKTKTPSKPTLNEKIEEVMTKVEETKESVKSKKKGKKSKK